MKWRPTALPSLRSKGREADTLRLLRRQPVLFLLILLLLAMLTVFIVLPLWSVVRLAISDGEQWSLQTLLRVLSENNTWKTLRNSLLLGGISAVLSTGIGFVFAFALTRTEMKGKRLFRMAATLPIISPPFVLSLSMIFLFGRQGLITHRLLGIEESNVYGLGSLVVVQVLAFFPIAYLTLAGILEAIDDSVEDAALSMGASRWQVFRTVTLPLALPGLASALLLVLIQSLEDFSNPAVLSGDFSTLAVEAYRVITGQFDMNTGSVLALLLLIPTLLAFACQRYRMRNRSFVTITGKPTQKRRKIHEKKIVWPLFAFCLLVTCGILMLYLTVIAASLVHTWGVNFGLTLRHYQYVLSVGRQELVNTLILALIAAPIGGFLGLVLAYLNVRKRFLGRKYLSIASLLSFAIPGTVLGIGYLNTFNRPPLLLTGGAVILVAAFVFRNLPVAIESGTATLLQVDPSLEEASSILGAGDALTFRKVLLPLLKQAFFSGLVYSFVRAITAVSTIIFLISPAWTLATSRIFSLFESSKYSDAAAYVTVLIAIILVTILILESLIHWCLGSKVERKQRKGRQKYESQ